MINPIINANDTDFLSKVVIAEFLREKVEDTEFFNISFLELLTRLSESEKNNILNNIEQLNIDISQLNDISWIAHENEEEITVKLIKVFPYRESAILNNSPKWKVNVYFGIGNKQAMLAILAGEHFLAAQSVGIIGFEIGYITWQKIFGSRFDVELVTGAARYIEKNDDAHSINGSLKLVYNTSFNGVRTSFGFSEGQSYAFEHAPNIETKNKNNHNGSKLMNYITVEAGVNLSDVFNTKSLKNCKAGFKIIHRSGIFGTIDAYNNINGGSNYPSTFIECKLGEK